MSLTLLQGYSSPEEEEEISLSDTSDEESQDYNNSSKNNKPLIPNTPLFDPSNPPSSKPSSLPSAFDVFSQITGPPKFLNNCADAVADRVASENEGQRWRQRHRKNRKQKTDLPTGAVVEAKAQLVGIHERVRSDAESGLSNTTAVQNDSLSTTQGVKRVATATNPNAEDAAELLRMCLQCGVPKTFSNAQGMVCPLCGDRPVAETDKESKKKGSAIKDKEKSKRMKGQSSHATWKSETEMQLRQQFD
ncbi:hypothetical protein DCAR_0101780 [Daucus carota subsp. sativus]|uniref:Uncharacterized protein n=1 Tax=Daucus carota subsp. sativus TaxID=79200 RepID=A0A166GMP5_DAUCS|nr:PREDICTED: uncharacterized protein LOC108204580 [Daucus carota subsp. sativus]WOG82615.1 hypothetical protein DCAR_0101780 [Daucus carota subsp. sativus]